MAGESILVVDDSAVNLRLAAAVLRSEGYIIQLASNAEQAIMMMRTSLPDLLLVDIQLPGISGLELTRQLRRQYPSLGVVMLSIHEGDEHAFNALQAGAADYRSKDINPKDLADILRRVARGEYVINDVVEKPKVASRLLSQFRSLPIDYSSPEAEFALFQPLSDREIEVLERIAAGGSNKEIADILGISTQTVKNHISSILRKLSLNDRTQAVLYALRRGWIETPDTIRGGGAPEAREKDEEE